MKHCALMILALWCKNPILTWLLLWMELLKSKKAPGDLRSNFLLLCPFSKYYSSLVVALDDKKFFLTKKNHVESKRSHPYFYHDPSSSVLLMFEKS